MSATRAAVTARRPANRTITSPDLAAPSRARAYVRSTEMSLIQEELARARISEYVEHADAYRLARLAASRRRRRVAEATRRRLRLVLSASR